MEDVNDFDLAINWPSKTHQFLPAIAISYAEKPRQPKGLGVMMGDWTR